MSPRCRQSGKPDASQAIEHDGGFDLAFVLQEVRDLRWTPLTGKNQTGGHRALLLRARNTAADEAAGDSQSTTKNALNTSTVESKWPHTLPSRSPEA